MPCVAGKQTGKGLIIRSNSRLLQPPTARLAAIIIVLMLMLVLVMPLHTQNAPRLAHHPISTLHNGILGDVFPKRAFLLGESQTVLFSFMVDDVVAPFGPAFIVFALLEDLVAEFSLRWAPGWASAGAGVFVGGIGGDGGS